MMNSFFRKIYGFCIFDAVLVPLEKKPQAIAKCLNSEASILGLA
jgi:hypothetical protein